MDDFNSFLNNLGDYEKSLQEEYEAATSSDNQEDIRRIIEKKIAEALPGFVDDLILIARAGDTDSSRLKAIQFAFNWYFKESNSVTDPFSKLLSDLTANGAQDENPQLRDKKGKEPA